jgi:hypothetical protein
LILVRYFGAKIVKPKKLRGLLDLAGGGAVLVGLIFVGLELRQNTEAVEAASLQNQTDASTEFLLLIASDVELTRIWHVGSNDPAQLSEIDLVRFFFMGRARWLRMQNAYLQWRRGTLSDEDWSIYDGLICKAGTTGSIRYAANWEEHRIALAESFVEFVENCLSKSQSPEK